MTNPYESPLTAAEENRKSVADGRVWSILACIAATFASATPIPSLLEMASYPPGTAMRPMGATAAVVLAVLGSLVVATPLALLGLFASRRSNRLNWFGYLALIIAILTVVGPPALMELIIQSRGYIMKE
jgi:hypothetical protein